MQAAILQSFTFDIISLPNFASMHHSLINDTSYSGHETSMDAIRIARASQCIQQRLL